jgi:hypothetical protein
MPSQRETPYALRLETDEAQPGRLRGRIEHVLSGRVQRFDDAAGLLAWLQQEQTRAVLPTRSPNPPCKGQP